MVREIHHEGKLIAILLTHDHSKPGLEFFTKNDSSLQLGYMKYPQGYRILPHVHKKVERRVDYTLEAIMVKSGRVRVDLYTNDKKPIEALEMVANDVILFTTGGHGFLFLEEGELVEIKQGPYVSQDIDKEKFGS